VDAGGEDRWMGDSGLQLCISLSSLGSVTVRLTGPGDGKFDEKSQLKSVSFCCKYQVQMSYVYVQPFCSQMKSY
jgi:hypothetical protein